MSTVDIDLCRQSLDALRLIRKKMYKISEGDLNAMSLDDQADYANSLHIVGLTIMKLEAAKLKGVNDKFKGKENELANATSSLKDDLAELEDAVQVIRVVSEQIKFAANVVKLLA